jgi:hypothetical protein
MNVLRLRLCNVHNWGNGHSELFWGNTSSVKHQMYKTASLRNLNPNLQNLMYETQLYKHCPYVLYAAIGWRTAKCVTSCHS